MEKNFKVGDKVMIINTEIFANGFKIGNIGGRK